MVLIRPQFSLSCKLYQPSGRVEYSNRTSVFLAESLRLSAIRCKVVGAYFPLILQIFFHSFLFIDISGIHSLFLVHIGLPFPLLFELFDKYIFFTTLSFRNILLSSTFSFIVVLLSSFLIISFRIQSPHGLITNHLRNLISFALNSALVLLLSVFTTIRQHSEILFYISV